MMPDILKVLAVILVVAIGLILSDAHTRRKERREEEQHHKPR